METEARTGEDEGGAIGDAGRSCPQYAAPNRDEAAAQAEEGAQLTNAGAAACPPAFQVGRGRLSGPNLPARRRNGAYVCTDVWLANFWDEAGTAEALIRTGAP